MLEEWGSWDIRPFSRASTGVQWKGYNPAPGLFGFGSPFPRLWVSQHGDLAHESWDGRTDFLSGCHSPWWSALHAPAPSSQYSPTSTWLLSLRSSNLSFLLLSTTSCWTSLGPHSCHLPLSILLWTQNQYLPATNTTVQKRPCCPQPGCRGLSDQPHFSVFCQWKKTAHTWT
jgi:hypothetical protein